LAGSPIPYNPTKARRTLFRALNDASAAFGPKRAILIDGDDRVLTYGELQLAALALGHALKKGTRKGESVGVLLPTGIGAVIATFALSAYGRVPAMLNFTAGLQSLQAALSAAKIGRILTAHRFIELGRFQSLETELKKCAELIYLDDLRGKLSFWDKAAAAIGSKLPAVIATRTSPDSPAVILFTSGTEGEPKGVVLSHANILANVEQVRAHIPLTASDIVFNPLPTFHSFGLTVGALMPVCLGIKAVLHPTPRQPREIAQRIRENAATILLATDTFVSQYMRAAGDGDLSSLRFAVCGAERLHDETRQFARRNYDFELLEGYGVTEGAPVLSANQPGANRPGTVGRLVACVQSRIEPVEGIREGGRLFVKGPNIMLGYLSPGRPGEIVALPDGWHDTGDVVSLDADGYIAIRGRLKRFAKIGGESVSLTVVENCASALWPDHAHAAITMPDGRKGESIVLLTTCPDAGRDELLVWARNHGVPELAVPRRVIPIADVPVLGTGKTDYLAVARIAAGMIEKPTSSVHE
jgi:acyl-[acyl-carrier-protein]-phospholipid O-acyltransferase/long-chain-fatty-acid--[acyl-carrier-protein] ligase